MAKKLISYDDEAEGLGLPEVVEEALDGAFAGRERAVEGLPLTDVTVTPRGTDPIPTEFFDGSFWGVQISEIHRSNDGGLSWEHVATVPDMGNLQRVIPTADGEVIAVSTTEVKRSTGWGTGSISWATVLTNPTPSFFHPWGISGDGQKFIIVHYAGSGPTTPERAASRYAWISTDQGHTWNIVWDTNEKFGEERGVLTHIHACEYDPWEDRFFISEGHEPDMTGVYVSYDDGATWGKITYGKSFDNPPGNSPTVVKATDYGVVFGSDDPTNGIMVMPRGTHTIERAYSRRGVSNTTLMGYAHMGARDPRTGQVYLVWELNEAYASDLGSQIMSSDGRVAGPVWEDTDTARRLWRRIAIDDQGNMLAWEQVTNSVLRARVTGVGVIPAHTYDAGRVLGGKTSGVRGTIAVGPEAVATGNRSVAVGLGKVDGFDGVAIGDAIADGNYSAAIGTGSNASNGGVAVGRGATTNGGAVVGYLALGEHSSSVAVGREAQAAIDGGATNPSTTAIGYRAKANASAGEATAVGREAEASGNFATALGSRSKAVNTRSTVVGQEASTSLSNSSTVIGSRASADTALSGTALGARAVVNNANSVALGADTTTSSTDQVNIGPRHIEALPPSSAPTPPSEGARLYTRVIDGKTQLVAQFPTGDPIVIAQEA